MATIGGTALGILMIGSTHYVDIGEREEAVIYYPDATSAYMRLPDKAPMSGSIEIGDDGYTVSWNDGPEGAWQIGHEPGVFTYLGPDGEPAGTISRIVPGDPEGFR